MHCVRTYYILRVYVIHDFRAPLRCTSVHEWRCITRITLPVCRSHSLQARPAKSDNNNNSPTSTQGSVRPRAQQVLSRVSARSGPAAGSWRPAARPAPTQIECNDNLMTSTPGEAPGTHSAYLRLSIVAERDTVAYNNMTLLCKSREG